MTYQPTKWSELLYVQRQPEDKNQFDNNWDRIFGKKDQEVITDNKQEAPNASSQSNHQR
jgi:hypothetical protein